MKPISVLSKVLLLAVFLVLTALLHGTARLIAEEPTNNSAAPPAAAAQTTAPVTYDKPAFSEFSLGIAASMLGLDFNAGTNLNQYLSLRLTGNLGRMNSSRTSQGIHASATLALATMGISLDTYPLAPRNRNWRISPGIMVYNDNHSHGAVTVPGGSHFTLNGTTYYASTTNPISGQLRANLHPVFPEFMITTGWDNIIPHKNHNYQFPFEIGLMLDGAPNLHLSMTSGQVCNAQGTSCIPVILNPVLQRDLAAQSIKYENDIRWLQTYPLCSIGFVYTFHSHRQ